MASTVMYLVAWYSVTVTVSGTQLKLPNSSSLPTALTVVAVASPALFERVMVCNIVVVNVEVASSAYTWFNLSPAMVADPAASDVVEEEASSSLIVW